MIIQDIVHDYDDECISDALDGACEGFNDAYDGPGTTREAIALAVSRYIALVPDHLLAGLVNAARDELVASYQLRRVRDGRAAEARRDCDRINEEMKRNAYTRIDAGTGREKPLDDRDWPDNGQAERNASVAEPLREVINTFSKGIK